MRLPGPGSLDESGPMRHNVHQIHHCKHKRKNQSNTKISTSKDGHTHHVTHSGLTQTLDTLNYHKILKLHDQYHSQTLHKCWHTVSSHLYQPSPMPCTIICTGVITLPWNVSRHPSISTTGIIVQFLILIDSLVATYRSLPGNHHTIPVGASIRPMHPLYRNWSIVWRITCSTC